MGNSPGSGGAVFVFVFVFSSVVVGYERGGIVLVEGMCYWRGGRDD